MKQSCTGSSLDEKWLYTDLIHKDVLESNDINSGISSKLRPKRFIPVLILIWRDGNVARTQSIHGFILYERSKRM